MWVALDPSTKFAFVTNQVDNTVSAFDVNSVTGGLQAAPGSPFSDPVGFGPTQAIVDPLGLMLYVVNEAGNSISMFAIDTGSGALTSLGPAPAGTSPLSITLLR